MMAFSCSGDNSLARDIWIDVGNLQDAFRVAGPDTVDVRQRSFDALVTGNFYSKKAWHGLKDLEIGIFKN